MDVNTSGSGSTAASSMPSERAARKKGAGWGLAMLLFGLLSGALIIFALFKSGVVGEEKLSVNSTTVQGSFEEIAELSTEEYVFTNIGKFEEDAYKLFGWNVPFTDSNFLVSYDGVVKAGVKDFSAIKVDVDDAEQVVRVSIPKVEVTSASIDQDSVVPYDQSLNPFNQITVEDTAGFFAAETKVAEDKAVELGLLDRAQDRVEELMTSHVGALLEGTEQADYDVEISFS